MDILGTVVAGAVLCLGVLGLIMLLVSAPAFFIFLTLAIIGGMVVFYGYKKGYQDPEL